VTDVTKNGSVVESYAYDANGNRLTKTIDGTTTTATHTIADQLETVGNDTYAYDEEHGTGVW
jgi:YD repeat-containing protein